LPTGSTKRRIWSSEARGTIDRIFGIEDTGLACNLDVKVGPDGTLCFSTANEIYGWGG
jgi:hypothetical protein